MPTITAHIIVRGAARAADWYVQALGAEIGARIRVPDGRYLQIELRIGDSRLMIADEFPEVGAVSPQSLGGTYGALTVSVDDADVAWQRALAAGAEVFHELEDAFWGDRHGQFIDPFGHRWALAQQQEEVAPEEVERRAAAPVRLRCGIGRLREPPRPTLAELHAHAPDVGSQRDTTVRGGGRPTSGMHRRKSPRMAHGCALRRQRTGPNRSHRSEAVAAPSA